MSRIQLQPAYVLHARAYRESSQLLEVFSRDHGRAGIVARGAKSGRSRWKNLLQPFRPLLISWSQRGDLGTMTAADQVAAPPSLAGEALYCGLYLNELLIRLLHRGDPHAELFERYREVLAGLAAGEKIQTELRLFEKHLLDATGFGLILDHDYPTEEPVRAGEWYEYRPDRGPVRVAECEHGDRRLVSGRTLLALRDERLEEGDLPPLRRLMRRVIAYHLGDKPLASHTLFEGLMRKGSS